LNAAYHEAMKHSSSYVASAILLLSFRFRISTIRDSNINDGRRKSYDPRKSSMSVIPISYNELLFDDIIVSRAFSPLVIRDQRSMNSSLHYHHNTTNILPNHSTVTYGIQNQCPISLPFLKPQPKKEKHPKSKPTILNVNRSILEYVDLGFLFMILLAMVLWFITDRSDPSSKSHQGPAAASSLLQESIELLTNAMLVAGIPAILSLLQNHWNLIASQHLQPITFNALNQTKTVFAALSCYFVLNQCQSQFQIMSLILLIIASMIMESIVPLPSWHWIKSLTTKNGTASTPLHFSSTKQKENFKRQTTTYGIVAVLAASLVSGISGALTQKSLQAFDSDTTIPLNPLLYSAQISFVSVLVSVVTILLTSPIDNWKQTTTQSICNFTAGWTIYTWIPVFTNALGGILVGLVVKHSGVIRKGFACMIGLFLSGILQNMKSKYDHNHTNKNQSKNECNEHNSSLNKTGAIQNVTTQQWIGGILATLSLFIHATFPYKLSSS
jgi:solute carrier family 35 (UDP-sugar transporter), member A1/2/3